MYQICKKNSKVHFLAISPHDALVLDAHVSVTYLKIAQICKNTCIFFHEF